MQTLPMTPAEKPIDAIIDLADTATKFKALGDPTRLRIYQFLRGQDAPIAVDDDGGVRPVSGPTVGEVCCHITGRERITSTISEHLKELRLAGLIVMERRGKNMICAVNPAETILLGMFFNQEPASGEECCPPSS
ncbi:MAG: winged helix-turn-helix transcriptional regulator [Akkermansiaceae bacterium]|nr:winged helix-turn-helix transcriptional regulator [Armatimonadota bacterium]